jgi:hypothetical protein
MTPAERVARLKQLYDQVKALNEEIAQLEAEDQQFVAFKQRSAKVGRKSLAYADYVRYSAYRDKLEDDWAKAGRPRNWEQAALLVKLRDVLLVTGPDAATPAAAAPAAPASAAASAPRGAVAPALVTRPAAAPAPAAASAPARPAASAPATGAPNRPNVAAASASPASAPASPASGRSSGRGSAAPTQLSTSQLIEMHSPILNEVGDLTKRAEEEFRMGQTANALVSIERATYLIERVGQTPPAMSSRLIKVLDDGLKEGAIADADRARREQVRERIAAVLAAAS